MQQSPDRLSTLFSALADPTRRAILAGLTRGEQSVQDLAKPFDISLPAVSRHLKVLEHAGLIERSREAQWRPCRLRPDRLKELDRWLDHYRRFWEESFDRLDDYLRTLTTDSKQTTDTSTARHRAPRKPRKGATDARRKKRRP